MRWPILSLIFVLMISVVIYQAFMSLPHTIYSDWIQGLRQGKYYGLKNFKPYLLSPTKNLDLSSFEEDYAQLWKEFNIGNLVVPLPVRHPLFDTVPVLKDPHPKLPASMGIKVLGSGQREITHIQTLPHSIFEDYLSTQELFKLPYVRKRILLHDQEKIWNDLFDKKIIIKPKPLDEMIYDLFLVYVRSRFFPSETLSYGRVDQSKVFIELKSKNADYKAELILHYVKGTINTYLIRSDLSLPESLRLRKKFLSHIKFSPEDKNLSRFIYKEFKALNYSRQIEQEGMLYLLSIWSLDMGNSELLRELIFYLERGSSHQLQLKPLYEYALKKFGTTFTTKDEFHPDEDMSVRLQRKTELEAKNKLLEVQRRQEAIPLNPDLSPEEKMNLYLKKAKENPKLKEDKEMVIH